MDDVLYAFVRYCYKVLEVDFSKALYNSSSYSDNYPCRFIIKFLSSEVLCNSYLKRYIRLFSLLFESNIGIHFSCNDIF